MPETLALPWSSPPSTLRPRSTTSRASPSVAVSCPSLLLSVSTRRSATRNRSGAGAAAIELQRRGSLLQKVSRVRPAAHLPAGRILRGVLGSGVELQLG